MRFSHRTVAIGASSRACGFLRQEEDEEVTLRTLWDGATYVGQTRSLLHNIASLYPSVGLRDLFFQISTFLDMRQWFNEV